MLTLPERFAIRIGRLYAGQTKASLVGAVEHAIVFPDPEAAEAHARQLKWESAWTVVQVPHDAKGRR